MLTSHFDTMITLAVDFSKIFFFVFTQYLTVSHLEGICVGGTYLTLPLLKLLIVYMNAIVDWNLKCPLKGYEPPC